MKLTLPQPALLDLINRGGAAAPKKSPIAVLEHFRLSAGDHMLALASSDMDRFAQAIATCAVEAPGACLVPAAAFKTLIAKHPKGAEVSLEAGDDFLVVKAGRSKVRLPTLPVADFPTWADQPPEAEFDMASEDFERALSRVRFAVSESIAHVYLQGVCIDATPGDALHFVATDRNILALSGAAMPEGAANCPRAIVPSETVDAALAVFKGAGKVRVAVNKKAASFEADGLRLSGRLIEGDFPNYQRIIPERGEYPSVTFDRAAFVDCLTRANVLVGSDGAFASIAFEPQGGEIQLTARNHKGGEASEALPGEFSGDFQSFRFDPRYAVAFLSTLNVKALTIEQADGGRGKHVICSQDAPDFLGLLMPVNL